MKVMKLLLYFAVLYKSSGDAILNSNVTNYANCGQTESRLAVRIIGGRCARECEKPWMVLIYNTLSKKMCGGSILNHQYILTAAHCIFDDNGRAAKTNEMRVLSGSSNYTKLSEERFVRAIILHEKYNSKTEDSPYDIALLKLNSPIVFDCCHKPLCLVDGGKSPQQATDCQVMGWGRTRNRDDQYASVLQYVDLPIASNYACQSLYRPSHLDLTFCAGTIGKDSCVGDSGGPLACKEADGKYYIYGIVTGGSKVCGNSLGLYTKVSAFLSWILEKTK